MIRLLVHVEGQTEESFVNQVLAPFLYDRGFSLVRARLMGNARRRDRRGGVKGWPSVRRDILRHLKEDKGCVVTTMVDYYGLPQSDDGAWPGRAEAALRPFSEKARLVEEAMLRDITCRMGAGFNARRLIPFLMMHEFEALLFSDCRRFGEVIGRPDLVPCLQQIRNAYDSPEEINDSPETAPSKRIQKLLPGYQKPLLGTLAVLETGMPAIRAACPHFSDWVSQLESMSDISP